MGPKKMREEGIKAKKTEKVKKIRKENNNFAKAVGDRIFLYKDICSERYFCTRDLIENKEE
jgi:hypothetical protein